MSVRHLPTKAHPDADGNPVSAEDWLGNRFAIGDAVIYCVGYGSNGGLMAVGRVTGMRFGTQGRQATPPVEVQVLTHGTPRDWIGRSSKRTRPGWINSFNVTAVTGIELAAQEALMLA